MIDNDGRRRESPTPPDKAVAARSMLTPQRRQPDVLMPLGFLITIMLRIVPAD